VPILQALAAKKQERKAETAQQQLTDTRDADMQNIMQAYQGTPEVPAGGAIGAEGSMGSPAVPGGRDALLKAMMQAKSPDIQNAGLQGMSGAKDNDLPKTIQEWNEFSQWTPEKQRQYLEMKRNPNILNFGNQLSALLPGGKTEKLGDVQLKPGEQPSVRKEQSKAAVEGSKAGEQTASLVEMEANLPRLEVVVGQLGELGKTATYTRAGQAQDVTRRELGLDPRKEAIARKEYVAKVDNEVLPLLRQTFGAAFTEREGASLKATLGDPNASPAEKNAVLRSFIDSKRAQVETQRRKVGLPETPKPAKGVLTPQEQSELDQLRKELNGGR